jgi:hypothetical protein
VTLISPALLVYTPAGSSSGATEDHYRIEERQVSVAITLTITERLGIRQKSGMSL